MLKLLKVLHYLAAVVLPATGVGILFFSAPISDLVAFIVVLYALPIFIVYAGICAVIFFPKTLGQAAWIVIPTWLSLIFNFWFQLAAPLPQLNLLSINTVPLYLGLYSVLIVGLLGLAYNQRNTKPITKTLLGLAVLLVLVVPIIYTMVLALNLSYAFAPSVTIVGVVMDSRSWLGLEALVIAAGYIPQFRSLYRAGRL